MNIFGVDANVWAEVVGRREVAPARIALAASLCPSVLGEVTKQSRIVDSKGRVEWTPYESLRETEQSDLTVQCHDKDGRVVIRNALVEWVMTEMKARSVLEELVKWDRKLGVWCVCALSETGLSHVRYEQDIYRTSLETTRLWALDRATVAQVRTAQEMASQTTYRGTSITADSNARDAIIYTSFVVIRNSAVDWIGLVPSAISNAHWAASSRKMHFRDFAKAEQKRSCEIIAEAIVNYPTRETVESSRSASERHEYFLSVPWRAGRRS